MAGSIVVVVDIYQVALCTIDSLPVQVKCCTLIVGVRQNLWSINILVNLHEFYIVDIYRNALCGGDKEHG